MKRVIVISPDAEVSELVRSLLPRDQVQVESQGELPPLNALADDLLGHDLLMIDLAAVADCERASAMPQTPCSRLVVLYDAHNPTERAAAFDIPAADWLAKPPEPQEWRPRLARLLREANRPTGANEHAQLEHEIAVRQEIQERLTKSMKRFELAARGSNDGLWDAELERLPEGRFWSKQIWFSARFKELLGFADDEFPNDLEAWQERLHPEDHDRVIETIQNHLAGQGDYDVQYRLLSKDGRYRWYSARGQAVFNAAGEPVRMAGSLRDITERRMAEEALRESEERYRVLVEVNPDVVIVHRGGRIHYINPAGMRLLGSASRDQLIGHPLNEIVAPSARDSVATSFRQLTQCGSPLDPVETCLLRFDGQTVPAEIVSAPVVLSGEDAVMTIGRDITERRRAAEAAHEQQLTLRKLLEGHERDRRLVAYEIHDGLVQYIAGAIMRLQSITESLNDANEDVLGELEVTLHLCRTALREARRLLSGIRPPILDESGVVASIDYLINETPAAETPAIVFRHQVQFSRLAPLIESNLFRIVQEALTNARRYSQAEHVWIDLDQEGERLRLTIRDDGVGFDPAKVQEERFGLQGIRERARLLGGQAVIESSPGHGTRISVQLPMIDTMV